MDGTSLSSPKVSLETQVGDHVAKEPRDSEDNTKSLGDVGVVGKGLGLVQVQMYHLDEFPLLSQASTRPTSLGICHLCVEHGLPGAGQSYSRPVRWNRSAETP